MTHPDTTETGSIGELVLALEKNRRFGTEVEVGMHTPGLGKAFYGYRPAGQFRLTAGGFETRQECHNHAIEAGYVPKNVNVFTRADHGYAN